MSPTSRFWLWCFPTRSPASSQRTRFCIGLPPSFFSSFQYCSGARTVSTSTLFGDFGSYGNMHFSTRQRNLLRARIGANTIIGAFTCVTYKVTNSSHCLQYTQRVCWSQTPNFGKVCTGSRGYTKIKWNQAIIYEKPRNASRVS